MLLKVIAVGRRMPDWVRQAWVEYAKRFPRGLSLDLTEIPLAQRPRGAAAEKARAREGDSLLSAIPGNFRVIALDERGRQWSTRELAKRLESWMREEKGVCFLVGGPDGLSEKVRSRADDTWSLGRLTLPHALVRPVLAEQLYRAWTITRNHPYHRD